MGNTDKVSRLVLRLHSPNDPNRAKNMQKRRAERDLKDLWQYIDAKYFLKCNKNELLAKVDQILRQTKRDSIAPTDQSKNVKTPIQVRTSKQDSQDQVTDHQNRSSRGLGLGLVTQGIDSDLHANAAKRSSKSHTHFESVYKSFNDLVNRPESLISLQSLEDRSFRQLYCEILDNLNVQTDWKLLIEKDHKNEEYREQLDRNIIKSKIRNIFDVEFNKKFEGSISIPIQTRSQTTTAMTTHRSRQQQSVNSVTTGGPQTNRYLFFITDKFVAEKKIEDEERLKLKRKLDIERIEETEKNNRLKRLRTGSNLPDDIWPSAGYQKNSTPKLGGKRSKDKLKGTLQAMDFGFLTTSTQVSSNGDLNHNQNRHTALSTPIANIDEELQNLERIYDETQKHIQFDTNQLKKRIVAHKEPDSVSILEQKIHQERVYLQNQIIQIEMKQIAESITRVTHAKKVSEKQQTFQDMVLKKYGPPIVRKTRHMVSKQHPKQTNGKKSASTINNASVQISLLSQDNKHERHRSTSSGQDGIATSIDQADLYIIKENIGTINRPLLLMRQLQLSAQKDRPVKETDTAQDDKKYIINSDGKATQQCQIDHLFRIEFDPPSGIPPCWVDTKTLNFFNTLRDNIFASSSQYDRFAPSNGQQQLALLKKKKRSDSISIVVDKTSVAYQRGKRSCTLQDIKNQGHATSNILNELSSGKRSVGPIKSPHQQKSNGPSLIQQADNLVKGEGTGKDQYLEYDFCHQCKQLKNKHLLVQCKYSSKLYKQPNSPYTPYPYEPQINTVNNIKIFNADLQNKSQLRGLIEVIKKDLKLKNQAVEAAKNQMKNFMISDGTGKGTSQLDIFAFQQHHPQLLAWIQDLDINPYTINPNLNQQLISDIKVLFPNFYQQLYQCQSPVAQKSVTSKSKFSQDSMKKSPVQSPNIDYECQRKFCSFCIRTNYDDNINECSKNKNWHCYHCTGYCMCTRCSRQDITTQLKAYLISLGGNLNVLRDTSSSIFDQLILKNFNEHLELTLGQNQYLYQKFPYYLYLLQNQDFVDPTQTKIVQSIKPKQIANQFGFISPISSPEKIKKGDQIVNSKINLNQLGQQNAEKAALSLLFKYSMLYQKYDDAPQTQNNINQKSSITDRQLIDQIMESVERHDSNVVQKIQKRRGRKRFILNNEDLSQDSVYMQCLNKREQKYLTKIAKMADQSLTGLDSSRSHPLLNGELVEFANEWPKSSKGPLQNIEKLLNQFGMDLLNQSNMDTQSQNSESASLKPRIHRGPGRPPNSAKRQGIFQTFSSVKKSSGSNGKWVTIKKNGQKVLRLNHKSQMIKRR